MLKETVLAKLEQSGVPIPTKPKKPTTELFDVLADLSDVPDSMLGDIHAKFAAWYCYANYLLLRANLDKMGNESNYTAHFNQALLNVDPDSVKNVTERKAIAATKTKSVNDKLQEAVASCLALETVVENLEIAMKTISREISRRQFVYSAAHNLSM